MLQLLTDAECRGCSQLILKSAPNIILLFLSLKGHFLELYSMVAATPLVVGCSQGL